MAVPGHQGRRTLCSRGHSLPCVLGTSARKDIPALPTCLLPHGSQPGGTATLPPPDLLLPHTWQGIPSQKGGSKWSMKAELPPCASRWHQPPTSTARGAALDPLPKAVGQTLKTKSRCRDMHACRHFGLEFWRSCSLLFSFHCAGCSAQREQSREPAGFPRNTQHTQAAQLRPALLTFHPGKLPSCLLPQLCLFIQKEPGP